MIELFLSACLLSNPVQCREVSLTYLEDRMSPYRCMAQSQVEIAKWSERNPKWFAQRWGCRPARLASNI